RRFTRHVRAGEQPDAASFGILRWRQVAVIRNERRAVARQRLLDDRMASAFDDEGMTVIDIRPRIGALGGKLSERARHVEARKRVGACFYVVALRDHFRCQSFENLELETERTL